MSKSGRSIGATAVRSTGWVVLEKWLGRTVSLVVFAILARILAPDAYGVAVLANVFATVLTTLIQQGFSKTIVQRKELKPVDIDTTFWTAVSLGFLLYTLLFLLSPLIAAGYNEPQLTWILRALGTNIIFMCLSSTHIGILERRFQFRSLAIRQLGGTIAGGCLGVGVAVIGGGAWALVVQMTGSTFIACVILWLASPWRPRARFSVDSFKENWRFTVSVLASEAIGATSNQLDNLVVGTFFGSGALGYYYIAFRVTNIVVELVAAIVGRVSFSTFSRLQSDTPRVHRAYSLMTLGTSMSSIPVLAYLAIVAPEIISIVFGPKWLPSESYLVVLAVAAALGIVPRSDRKVMLALGHSGVGLRMSITRQVVGAGFLFAAVPFGVAAIPWARVARSVAVWPMRAYSLPKYAGMGFRVYGLPFVRVAVPVLVAAAGTWATRSLISDMSSLLRLGVLTTLFAVACVVTMAILAPSQLREAAAVLRSARASEGSTRGAPAGRSGNRRVPARTPRRGPRGVRSRPRHAKYDRH